MARDWNALTCVWTAGGGDPPILGPSPYDYVMSKRFAADMLKTGDYPQEVFDTIPQAARENTKLFLLSAIGYEDEMSIVNSEEYGYELDGTTYWCTPTELLPINKSSDMWPLVLGTGLGAVAGLAIAVFAPGKPLGKQGTIATTATLGFMGLLGGMVWNAYKGSA